MGSDSFGYQPNVLLQQAGGELRAVLADFGLARAIEHHPEHSGLTTPHFHRTSTVPFSSPELIGDNGDEDEDGALDGIPPGWPSLNILVPGADAGPAEVASARDNFLAVQGAEGEDRA